MRTDKLRQDVHDLCPPYLFIIPLGHFAIGVLRIGANAERDFKNIFFVFIDQNVKQPRCSAEAYRQHPRGGGIKRA